MAENDKPSAGAGVRGQIEPQCEVVMVYTTFPSLAAAESMGQSLITRKLAGCINILPGMVSIYAWQGTVERSEEAVLIAKTASDRAATCMSAIIAGHPYETPAVLLLPIAAGSAAYLDWILNGTRGG